MNQFRKPFLIILINILFLMGIGCSSDDSNGTGGGGNSTSVTGTWSGNYVTTSSSSGNSNYSGDLTLSFTQSGSIILGTASGSVNGLVNGTQTNTTFDNEQINGSISDRTLNVTILFGAYQVILNGTVTSDTTSISGTWNGDFSGTGSDSASGTWTVLLVSTSTT